MDNIIVNVEIDLETLEIDLGVELSQAPVKLFNDIVHECDYIPFVLLQASNVKVVII